MCSILEHEMSFFSIRLLPYLVNMKKLLIISTSTVHGKPYLSYIQPTIQSFFKGAKHILFVPFARPSGLSHAEYTEKAAAAFSLFGFHLKGVQEFNSYEDAFDWGHGVFVGGGNTFLLLKQLYETGLYAELKARVNNGFPYMGTSAGSNITGQSICTTNDMPIVYPPSFDALGFVPFNINPHYLDPIPNSTHMGETRETRIAEFHYQASIPVLGLREGSWLDVSGKQIKLGGELTARLFCQGKAAKEIDPSEDILIEMGI
jgi:dipeptidase E